MPIISFYSIKKTFFICVLGLQSYQFLGSIISVMRKISKATKRAIEAGATLTPTRRKYTPRMRLSTGPAVGMTINRSPWRQRNRNEAHIEKKLLNSQSRIPSI